MLGRRRLDTDHPHPGGSLGRSALADAAWAVEERLVWGAGDAIRGFADFVAWPFERAGWALERRLLWPLQERAAPWEGTLRTAGAGALVVAALLVGVVALLWAAPGGGEGGTATIASPPAPPAPAPPPGPRHDAPPAPTLQGPPPRFAPPPDARAAKGGEAVASAAGDQAAAAIGPAGGVAAAVGTGEPAGPAALEVARRFANAFALYETGRATGEVRAALRETATPRLAHQLLSRPPRLPADGEVPRAKVLNVVAAPSHGGAYPVSVSMLRLGLTSELRLEMGRAKDGGWQVTEVLG